MDERMDDAQWMAEEEAYFDLWQHYYAPLPADAIPEWHSVLADARSSQRRREQLHSVRQKAITLVLGGAAAAALAWAYLHIRRKSLSRNIPG